MVHMLVVKAPLLVSSTTMLVVEAPLLGSSTTVGAEATADKVPETGGAPPPRKMRNRLSRGGPSGPPGPPLRFGQISPLPDPSPRPF